MYVRFQTATNKTEISTFHTLKHKLKCLSTYC